MNDFKNNYFGMILIGFIMLILYLIFNIMIFIGNIKTTFSLIIYDLLYLFIIIIMCYIIPMLLYLKKKNLRKQNEIFYRADNYYNFKLNEGHLNMTFIYSIIFLNISILTVLLWYLFEMPIIIQLVLIVAIFFICIMGIVFSPFYLRIIKNDIYIRSLFKYKKNINRNKRAINYFINPNKIDIKKIKSAEFINEIGFKTINFKLTNSTEVNVGLVDKIIWYGLKEYLRKYKIKIKIV